jgi:putative transposase
MAATARLPREVATAPVCRALGLSRAVVYRRRNPAEPKAKRAARSRPARALDQRERQEVLDTLHAERFCDQSPVDVYATLLEEDRYLCSPRTMYRILADSKEVRERRNQLRHPRYHRPELVATRPNQVWSWDITKLKGPIKWTYYHLYVMLDLFSRYVVGWLLAMNESASLAARLVSESCAKQNVREGDLTIHADRGTAMISKTLAEKLIDLGVKKSHSRPRVSNDNPYSEAQFKTLKYSPGFPDRFESPQHALQVLRTFVPRYNHEHHHSALRYMTPASVHHGRADRILAERHRVLTAAYLERPERFVNGPPRLERLPEAVWINPPEKSTPQIAQGPTLRTEDDPEVVPILTTHAPITRPGALATPQGCGLVTQ